MTATAPGGAPHGTCPPQDPGRPHALAPGLRLVAPVVLPAPGDGVPGAPPPVDSGPADGVPAAPPPVPGAPADGAPADPPAPAGTEPADLPRPGPGRSVQGTDRARRAGRVAVLVAALAVPVVAALLLSPIGALREVEVRGASPRWEPAVRAAAAPELGRPALLVDTAAVTERVRAVPGVGSAAVGVRWPGRLVVEVRERVAAAAVPLARGVRLVDAAGVDLGEAPLAPPAVPEVVVGGPGSAAPAGVVDPQAVLAALSVRAALPVGLAGEVERLGTTGREGVWFVLRDGSTVVWGSAGGGRLKAEVLRALRTADPAAARYDVSAPDAPAVTPR